MLKTRQHGLPGHGNNPGDDTCFEPILMADASAFVTPNSYVLNTSDVPIHLEKGKIKKKAKGKRRKNVVHLWV